MSFDAPGLPAADGAGPSTARRARSTSTRRAGATIWQNAHRPSTGPPAIPRGGQSEGRADAYLRERLATPQTGPRQGRPLMFFLDRYAPNWMELYELFEATVNRSTSRPPAKARAASAEFVWMCPGRSRRRGARPTEGGHAPVYRKSDKLPRIDLPEERVPAWRVSEIGLNVRSSARARGTAHLPRHSRALHDCDWPGDRRRDSCTIPAARSWAATPVSPATT